jgi:signal transduction histidine kinase
MQRRISNLFAVRHSEVGQLILKRGPCAIAPLIRAVVERLLPIAAAKDIAISCTVVPTCEGRQLFIDGERIADATRELIYNAIKNTDQDGTIAVSVSLAGDKELVIAVADTGRGIAPQHHRRIFNRRDQAQQRAGAPHQGFGLGLHFVRRIVDLHNGVVEVESTDGKGARFTIRICLPDPHPLATMSWRTEEISALRRYGEGHPIRLCRSAVAATALAHEAVERFRALAEERGLQLTTLIDPPVASVELRVDHEHVRGALEELICNAIKFTPEGGRVSVQVIATRSGVQYEIVDSGPGIAAEHHSAIFEPGVQLPLGQPQAPGLGLGLSYARMVARLHNGALSITSRPGGGTALLLALPLNPLALDSDQGSRRELKVSAP